MIELIGNIVGFDFGVLASDQSKRLESGVYRCFYLLVFIFSLSFFSIYHAFKMTTESIFLSTFLALFIVLFLLNTYRLIFSLTVGAINKSNFYMVAFIFKRSIVLIILSIFISKSIETIVFKRPIEAHLKNYKTKLLNDFDRLQQLNLRNQIMNAENDYESKIAFDKLIGKDRKEIHTQELNTVLEEVENKFDKNEKAVKKTISKSNFFITAIKILTSQLPNTWLFTILIVGLFLYPIYMFLTDPFFVEYNMETSRLNRELINKEYVIFKKKYVELAKETMDGFQSFEEKYHDPPYNTLKIESSSKFLEKGTLLKLFQNYEG